MDIDSNGRVTLPQELRSLLKLNGADVQLLIFGEVIQIHREADVQHSRETAAKVVAENIAALEALEIQ